MIKRIATFVQAIRYSTMRSDLLQSGMETKDARRRRKLNDLVQGTPGGIPAVAALAEVSRPYLTQILKGALLPVTKTGVRNPRALGDAVAEKLEDACHLGRGWFDSDRPLPSPELHVRQSDAPGLLTSKPWPFESFTLAEYREKLTPEQKAVIEAMIFQMIRAREPPLNEFRPGTRVAHA